MRLRWLLALALAGAVGAQAQDEGIVLDDLVQEGLRWAKENVDEDVWRALGGADERKTRQFFEALQKQFHGEYVVDLASLKPAATSILLLLEEHDESRPYAAWLRTRLDYFEVADQFRLRIQPPPTEPGQPPKPIPNPAPEEERQAWEAQFQKRPAPKGALAYATRLKPVFAARKMPPELVWVAEVESSFDPTARSPAGAAGVFQLMPRTAQAYGLSLRPQDERLNPEKSAAAAATYLRHLHGQFKEWRLALADYNAGEGNLRQLMDRYNCRTFDRVSVRLPAETQMYVPKVEAALRKREGVKLSDLPAPKP